MIDLSNGKVVIKQGERVIELSKAETLLSRDTKDVNRLLTTKLGHTPTQTYYFNRDTLYDAWECISGPLGLKEPLPGDWPSTERSRK